MTSKFKVAFFSTQKYDSDAFSTKCPSDLQIDFFSQRLSRKSSKLCDGYDAICCFVNDTLDEEVLAELSKMQVGLIALRCAGYNNVDMMAADKYGIKVVRVPSYSPQAVAEHCISLIMTLSRKTHKAYNRVKENNFDLNGLLGFNIHKKTVGVIGLGKIGKAFVNIAKGFGANVLYFDPGVESDICERVELEKIYRDSDIIALHCPLNEHTHHIINSNSLSQMKDGVMLINTSRGALIDTKACIDGLKSKKIGHLGLDVYEQESELFFQDLSSEIIEDDTFQRLLTFPNVLITGHQGFFTREALSQIVSTTLENIKEYQRGEDLSNEVE